MKKMLSLLTALAVALPMSLAMISVTSSPAQAAISAPSATIRRFHKPVKTAKTKRVPKVHTHNKEKIWYQVQLELNQQ